MSIHSKKSQWKDQNEHIKSFQAGLVRLNEQLSEADPPPTKKSRQIGGVVNAIFVLVCAVKIFICAATVSKMLQVLISGDDFIIPPARFLSVHFYAYLCVLFRLTSVLYISVRS